jgi:polar amino acid transport system substrate-binding protein
MKYYVQFLLCLALILALGVYSPVQAENPVLKVVLYEEQPYQFVSDQGSASGLLVEFFDAIAQNCGYSTEYSVMPSLTKCVQALNQGDADVILGMPSRNQYNLSETVEIYSSSMVLLGHAGPIQKHSGDNTEFSVGYDYNTISSTILPRLMSNHHVISSKQNTLLNYLQNNKADAVIVDRLIAGWYYKDWDGEKPKVLNDYLETVKYSIALRPEGRILLRELNTGILEFRLSGDYSNISSRWSISEPSQKLVLLLRRTSLILFICTAGAMFYILINNRIRNMLKQEVQEKTLALQCANQSLANQLEQLQFQDELRCEIINNSANGLVLVDKEYRVQMINQRAATLAKVSSNQEGLMLVQLPRFWALANRIGPDLFSGDIRSNSLSFEYKAPSGHTERLLGSVHYIYHNKEVTGALLSMEDITFELEVAKKSFEREKNYVLNRMVAGIAHEIKNPLMSIRTYACLIPHKIDDPDFRASFAEFVPRESDRINHLVESLVNYAKPVQGEPACIDLFGLVRDCAYFSEVASRNTAIRFNLSATGNFYIYSNSNQVKQILINIIINGIESIERKLAETSNLNAVYSISVTAYADGEYGCVQVRDEGIGMNDYVKKHCIDLFYTTKERGSGLGLALSSQYIRENGGSLEIESEEGQYTCITLRFRSVEHETKYLNYR